MVASLSLSWRSHPSTACVLDGRELIAKVPIRFADMNFQRADTIPVAWPAGDCRAFTPTL